MNAAVSQVTLWLKADDVSNTTDLTSIVCAYSSNVDSLQVPNKMLDEMEKAVLKRCTQITSD